MVFSHCQREENAGRKCLCFYYDFIDREFELMHVRIQSWFPLVIQIRLNGHKWLSRKLDAHGIENRKQDNAFLWISDCGRAQKFADRFEKKNWPRAGSVRQTCQPAALGCAGGTGVLLGHGPSRIRHGCHVQQRRLGFLDPPDLYRPA